MAKQRLLVLLPFFCEGSEQLILHARDQREKQRRTEKSAKKKSLKKRSVAIDSSRNDRFEAPSIEKRKILRSQIADDMCCARAESIGRKESPTADPCV